MRLAWGFVAALFALSALPSSADPDETGDLLRIPEGLPIYCAFIGSDRQVCTWHEGRSHHTVCELDLTGSLAGELCFQQKDNDLMTIFSHSMKKYRNTLRALHEIRKVCRGVLPTLEAAKSIRQVSELVGAGPVFCQVVGDVFTCKWHGVRRTPGYATLARVTMNEEGHKINLICKFKESGRNRDHGSCKAGSADVSANLYQALNCQ